MVTLVQLQPTQLPRIDLQTAYEASVKALCPSQAEAEWFTPATYNWVFGLICSNAIHLRPMSPLQSYLSTLKGHLRSHRATVLEILQKAAPDVPARDLDEHYRSVCSADGVGLFNLQCKLNHRCVPNAECRSSEFAKATLDIVALEKISPGREVCISYVDTQLGVADRRAKLSHSFFFSCHCARCQEELENTEGQ